MTSGPASRPSPPPSYLLEGRYLAVEPIGQGETSEVFQGTDTWSGELVAVRMLRPDRPDRARRFQHMAERLFGFSSSRVVRAIHLGDDRNGRPFLVTEMLIGRSLDALGRVRWEVACEVARQAALGLSEIHLNGQAHGNLRAAKIFVGKAPEAGTRVKLLDLGTGERGATPPKDRRALASILHRLLTGKPPLPTPTQPKLPDAPPELAFALSEWLYDGDAVGASLADIAVTLRQIIDPNHAIEKERDSEPISELLVLPKSSVKIGD